MTKHKLRFFIVIILLVFVACVFFDFMGIRTMLIRKMYPKYYSTEVSKYAKEYNLDENLIYAVIKAESNFDPEAHSRKNAKGLMQLMFDTANDVAKMLDMEIDENMLLDPEVNIKLGTKYLSFLIEKYNNIEVAIAAYNAGSGNVDNWINNGTIKADGSDIENIPFKETNNYVRKILRDYKIYIANW